MSAGARRFEAVAHPTTTTTTAPTAVSYQVVLVQVSDTTRQMMNTSINAEARAAERESQRLEWVAVTRHAPAVGVFRTLDDQRLLSTLQLLTYRSLPLQGGDLNTIRQNTQIDRLQCCCGRRQQSSRTHADTERTTSTTTVVPYHTCTIYYRAEYMVDLSPRSTIDIIITPVFRCFTVDISRDAQTEPKT